MFLRQGSQSLPTPAPVHSQQLSNGYHMGASDLAQPPPASQEALPTSDVFPSEAAQAEGGAPDTTNACARTAAPSSQVAGEATTDLHTQPHRTASLKRYAGQPQTGTGMGLQHQESPETAAQARIEGETGRGSMSMEVRDTALQPRDTSVTVHALEPSQDGPQEAQPGDWREQQQRWLQTPSGLAEAAGLQTGSDYHNSAVPATKIQSDVGQVDSLPSLGSQQKQPHLPFKVSNSSVKLPGLAWALSALPS